MLLTNYQYNCNNTISYVSAEYALFMVVSILMEIPLI